MSSQGSEEREAKRVKIENHNETEEFNKEENTTEKTTEDAENKDNDTPDQVNIFAQNSNNGSVIANKAGSDAVTNASEESSSADAANSIADAHKHVIPTMTVPSSTTLPSEPSSKPATGTEEWHKWRKLNHKEVEKRRREAINQGIKELQDLLPTQDNNKSQIIKRAVEYIKRLKENEDANIEKWTLEKLITDQAVSELANSNEKLKAELEKTYREAEGWRRAYSKADEEVTELKKQLEAKK